MTPKVGKIESANQAEAVESTLDSHGVATNKTCLSQGLEPSAILYANNQPADLQL